MIENEGNFINISKIDLNTSTNMQGKELIEDNIRKSRIKEIKQAKELLEKKLYTLDCQVEHLMNEEENNQNKKFNLKQYLENFEKDKALAESRALKWEHDKKERMKHLNEMEEKTKQKIQKQEEIQKEKLEKKKLKEKADYERKLRQFKNHRENIHEEVTKLKEEWGSKIIVNKPYKYQSVESEFNNKMEREMEEKKNLELMELMRKRSMLKPINREEINEFSRKVQEERERILMEKGRERINKQEEMVMKNENMPKPDSQSHHKILEEEKHLREMREKEKLDKIYKSMKIKQFSKVIKTELLPRVDENKRKEVENRIMHMRSKSKKKHVHKQNQRVLLKKPDPNKPKKYKWKLKLNTSEDYTTGRGRNKLNRSKSAKSFTRSLNNSNSQIKPTEYLDEEVMELKKKASRSRSAEKRKPMEKNPDYLTEMRIKKSNMNSSNALDKEKEKQSNIIIYNIFISRV
jgi:hypothetical protein